MRISISFNFIEIFKPKYAIFRALFITLIDFVSLMSTIFNHEHKVWSACAHGIKEHFSFDLCILLFSRYHVLTNSLAPSFCV